MSAPLPFKSLRYLYLGCSDVPRDLAWYVRVLGGQRLWHFDRFGAQVAAVCIAEGPVLLLASHRPPGSCMLIYDVDSLAAASAALKARGWKPVAENIDIPGGPCSRFDDPSGNPLAIFEDRDPDKMTRAYADPGNPSAVRA